MLFSIIIKIVVGFFFLHQSRTPALVFEHVNNTDFKVGAKQLSHLLNGWCVNLLSWHTRCFSVLVCVCDGGIWKVQCYVFGARKSAIFWFYPQSLAHCFYVCGSRFASSMTSACLWNCFVFVSSNFTRHWQTMTFDSTCTRFLRSVFFFLWLIPLKSVLIVHMTLSLKKCGLLVHLCSYQVCACLFWLSTVCVFCNTDIIF